MNNILSFISTAKQMTATEYAAPCPECGGRDRFRIWTEKGKGGSYWCRQCGIKGDGITFLRTFQNMTYQDACAALGIVLEKRSNHTKQNVQVHNTQPSRRQWSASAAVVMRHCQKQVTIPAIQERHLTPETCLACGIGYNAHDQYPLRVAWGLDNEQLEGGKVRTKLKIPQGIVIATFRHHEIVALTVRMTGRMTGRTHDPKCKYWQVKGSDNVPFLLGRAHTPLVLLESALDAVLLYQESGVSCAAFMGSTKTPDDNVMQAASVASVVLACPDNDSAGHKA